MDTRIPHLLSPPLMTYDTPAVLLETSDTHEGKDVRSLLVADTKLRVGSAPLRPSLLGDRPSSTDKPRGRFPSIRSQTGLGGLALAGVDKARR